MDQQRLWEVLVNGSPLPNEAAVHLVELTVDEDVSVPSHFILRLAEADDLEKAFRWVDDDGLFAIGNAVEIRLRSAGAMTRIMSGEITALEPDFGAGALTSLTVRGYDRRHRLQRGRKTRTFVQQKDSDIAAQIASEAGLRVEAENTGVVLDYVLQNNCTDLELLQERAAPIGYEVVVEDKTLFFRPAGYAESNALSLTLHQDLSEILAAALDGGAGRRSYRARLEPKDQAADQEHGRPSQLAHGWTAERSGTCERRVRDGGADRSRASGLKPGRGRSDRPWAFQPDGARVDHR